MSLQAPSSVVMVRPHHFAVNEQTAADNVFQTDISNASSPQTSTPKTRAPDDTGGLTLAHRAFTEATALADALEAHGVRVHLFDDDAPGRPDSVFPNNWFSTHPGGRIAVYPMCSHNRRRERRGDVIDMLKEQYRVQDVIDYSGLEHDGLYLEGTGAMVLDHLTRIAYVARSNRADPIVLERFCTHFGYEPMAFDAFDQQGVPIYHTNVLMCIATSFALVCLDSIRDIDRRREVVDRLSETGRVVIDITQRQLAEFAGNAFEMTGRDRRILAMSGRARRALTAEQIADIEGSCQIVAVDIPTIEMAGGSVRCMLAGIHLDPRPTSHDTTPPTTNSVPTAQETTA